MLPLALIYLTKKIKMKKVLYVVILVMTALFTACTSGENKKAATTTETENSGQLYACSMHPELTGKKDAECSKCGMKLTVPVKTAAPDTLVNKNK